MAVGCSASEDTETTDALRQAAQLPSGANYLEVGGSVVVEAEDYSASTTVAGQSWQVLAAGDASGAEAMTTPDLGRSGAATTELPQLDYNIRFVTPGTYNVWVRGRSLTGVPASGNSNSVHIGLDGTFTTSDNISNFQTTWSWYRSTLDGPTATVTVGSTGIHTLNIRMREDGFAVDKVYLTTANVATPSGVGPAVSELSNPGFLEHGGFVVFEAENYTDSIAGADTWDVIADGTASEGSAVQAQPDNGTALSAIASTSSGARLDFPVTFTRTGSYTVWIRGRANPSARTSSDSVHFGVDGTIPATSDDIGPFASTFRWVRATPSGDASINIGSAGDHTVSIYVREDGFVADKIVLVHNTVTFSPTGTGPNETPDVADPCADASLNGNETDLDCGGDCGACADGATCATGSDCISTQCDGATNVCTPYDPCSDGIVNGTETGLDCGGACEACSDSDLPFLVSGGTVSIEAESTSNVFSDGPATWTPTADVNASGGSYLESTPDSGASYDPVTTLTPRVDFPVYFDEAGVYRVWIRGASGETRPTSDSIHVGLDGISLASSDRMTGFGTTWGWMSRTIDGPTPTVAVASAGLHSINVWVREDGFKFDKIVITQGASPTGLGPAESARAAEN
jgi:hypothetical protein